MLILTVKSYKNRPAETQIVATFDKCIGGIGRSSKNTWVISDPHNYISAFHAVIEYENNKYYIKDISTNGVFINYSNKPLGKGNSVQLNIGDTIIIGEYEIDVDIEIILESLKYSYSIEEEIESFQDDPFFDFGEFGSTDEKSSTLDDDIISDDLFSAPQLGSSAPKVTNKKVEFAVFSPCNIKKGSMFKLDVWAYLPNQYRDVQKIAREMGQEHVLARKHAVPIPDNTILTVTIEIGSIPIKDSTDTMIWDGEPTNASFTIDIPASTSVEQLSGKAFIAYEGITIATISFIIPVDTLRRQNYIDHSQSIFYPKTAFASYSSKNREEVLSRLQGMKKVAPDLDIFFDVFSLRSGENWKKRLEEEVTSKNIFYLFWSKHSAKSKWVSREWHLALQQRGLKYISPIPLDDLNVAPPPAELEMLHFSDAYIAYIQYEKLKKKMEKHEEK